MISYLRTRCEIHTKRMSDYASSSGGEDEESDIENLKTSLADNVHAIIDYRKNLDERRLSFCMGVHTRLGSQVMCNLTSDTLRMILMRWVR